MKHSISVVMGMYNEKENVVPVITEVGKALETAQIPYEIICVSNGSTDGTNELLMELSKQDSHVKGIILQEKGYGRAVTAGFNTAENDWVTLVSGDGQVDPGDILKVYKAMEEKDVDIVKPRRIKRDDHFFRKSLVKIFNLIVKVLFLLPGWDIDGPPKLIKREFLNKLELESIDFFIDAEMMIKAKYLGGTMTEVPVGWRERERGTPFIANALIATSWQYLKNVMHWRIHHHKLVVEKLRSYKK
jgi:glycosyltransferase involved in cell wall biosynthesis